MTFDERVTAVSEFGFTTRQARFLVTVMLHGGVCVPRQYARFAGIAYGHKVNVFFDKLVSMRYAVGCRCVHNRAAVYHVHHQPLYRVIGEPHNRNRKPVPAPRVIERLMLLDAVNSHPELRWLATATDKVVYFRSASPSGTSLWPQHTVARTRRYFQDHLPIGVSPTGRVVFVFLATTPMTDNLKAFLGRHVDLLQALPDWTVRLVMPPPVAAVRWPLEAVVRDQLSDALAAGGGWIESEVLPLSYRHLSPLTGLVRPIPRRVEKGEHVGEHTLTRPQPRRIERDDDDPAGCAGDWRGIVDAHLRNRGNDLDADAQHSARRRSLPPWPRCRVVMARNVDQLDWTGDRFAQTEANAFWDELPESLRSLAAREFQLGNKATQILRNDERGIVLLEFADGPRAGTPSNASLMSTRHIAPATTATTAPSALFKTVRLGPFWLSWIRVFLMTLSNEQLLLTAPNGSGCFATLKHSANSVKAVATKPAMASRRRPRQWIR